MFYAKPHNTEITENPTQETSIYKLSVAIAQKLLNRRPHKANVVRALQSRDPASKINFWNWLHQPLHDGEADSFFLPK
jgi:hypothetical protein